ncbi:MAG: 50S ribosomal protein L11 methyltransferase [Candidatus Thorarchaeota archaeon]|nr:50S ribosomal protein L11 methyltransferase [Candidatus Thorarchaeota archaeon]
MAKLMKEKKIATPFALLHVASLLSQRTRIQKFAEAINRIVKQGMRVIDIGTGSGVLALLAAQAGASEVTAIDINKESIEYAQLAARMNGFEDRIRFEVKHFEEFIPDEKYDVVICEMLSSMMLIEQQIPASSHAAKHILKPEGVMIPGSLAIYIALTECESAWSRFCIHDLRFPKLPQTIAKEDAKDLSDLAKLASFDLVAVEESRVVECDLNLKVVQKGVVHGLVGLFDAEVYKDIRLIPEDGWRELFLPFDKAIDVDMGDEVRVKLSFIPGQYESLSLSTE